MQLKILPSICEESKNKEESKSLQQSMCICAIHVQFEKYIPPQQKPLVAVIPTNIPRWILQVECLAYMCLSAHGDVRARADPGSTN